MSKRKLAIICSGVEQDSFDGRSIKWKRAIKIDYRKSKYVDIVFDMTTRWIPVNLRYKFDEILMEGCPVHAFLTGPSVKYHWDKRKKNVGLNKYFWINIYVMLKRNGKIIFDNFLLFKRRQLKKRGVSYERIFYEKLKKITPNIKFNQLVFVHD